MLSGNRAVGGLARTLAGVREAICDGSLDERFRQRTVDGEVQRALGHSRQAHRQAAEDRAAERQIGQVILERGDAADGFTADAEGVKAGTL